MADERTEDRDGEFERSSARSTPDKAGPRPEFARAFPRHPALDALVAAFEAGDFGRVRTQAPKLAASSEPEEVRRAAALLLSRTKADPLAAALLAIAAILLVALSAWWIVQHGGGQG